MKFSLVLITALFTQAFAIDCPKGFVSVSSNPTYDVKKDFCVMQFPAKKSAKGTPASVKEGLPWININLDDAKAACSKLGAGFGLISNPQWMTIADEIIGNSQNWSSNEVGVGFINKGHSDNDPAKPCPTTIENVNSNCNASGNKFDQKRTHSLKNGEKIWDLAGNLWEWVDWDFTVNQNALLDGRWREFDRIEEGGYGKGLEKKWLASAKYPGLNSLNMVGVYWANRINKKAGMIRGGRFHKPQAAGILAVDFSIDPSESFDTVTFRCVKN